MVNRFSGSNTIFSIPKSQVPQDRKVLYGRKVYDIKQNKSETHLTILTIVGNLIYFAGKVTTPTADITTAKSLINDTILTPQAKFLCADIANFYLNTPLELYSYIQPPFYIIPQ